MPRFPDSAGSATGLSNRVFSELARKAQSLGKPVFPLHVGDTFRDPIPEARAEAQRAAEHAGLHRYSPPIGEPELLRIVRDRVRHCNGIDLAPEQFQIVAGGTSGLSVVAQTILEPGDEMLLPSPYWPLIRGVVASRGAIPVEIPFFDRLSDPSFDFEQALERAVTDRTAALYINTPHNPTGRILSQEVIDAMGRVADRHDLWVICDEAYEDIWFGSERPAASWTHERILPRAIVCHTLTKSYGLAGARVGYVHGPAEIMRSIRGVQTFQNYCASRPMQLAGAQALQHGDEWMSEARRLYRHMGELAAKALGVPPAQGSTFLFFDTGPWLSSPEDSCVPFLERCVEAGVLLTPGAACGRDYARWVRLCFTSIPPAKLEIALQRLATVCS